MRRKCGSSLIETLIALALLATFVSGASILIVMNHRLTDKAQDHYSAINIAKDQIEQVRNLRNMDFAQLLALQENGVRIDKTGRIDTHGLFRRSTRITKDSHNDYLINVQVRVDLINRITRTFDGEHEMMQSYMAHMLD